MRLAPKDRKKQILDSALALSVRGNYRDVTREALASHVPCSPALVSFYFGSMTRLRHAIMTFAVQQENLIVLAQGLAVGDIKAKKAPHALREKAARILAGEK